jgi:hypothetical protein
MTDMPARFDAAAEDTGAHGRINGVVDVPRPGRVAGWAIDRSDPEAGVTVRITREGRVVGEVRADQHRPDLERGGIGSGRYGFALDLDPPLETGFEFTVAASARADDGTTAELRRVGRAKPAEDPARRLAERSFEELWQLRGAVALQSPTADASIRRELDRIELVQARLETALSSVEPPERPGNRGLMAAVAFAVAVATASLGLGIWSIVAG